MQFKVKYETLFDAFIESSSKLLKEIKEMEKKVDKEDPDPEVTKAHHLDRILRKWFNQGGGLGY